MRTVIPSRFPAGRAVRRCVSLALTAGGLVLLPACNRQDSVAAPAVAPAGTDEVAVADAPPPLQPEVRETQPGPDYVWIGGYWNWHGGRHEWVRGKWERPPQGRREWVPPRWEHRDRGYVLVQGRWN
jgi:hypothetical protein